LDFIVCEIVDKRPFREARFCQWLKNLAEPHCDIRRNLAFNGLISRENSQTISHSEFLPWSRRQDMPAMSQSALLTHFKIGRKVMRPSPKMVKFSESRAGATSLRLGEPRRSDF
jgi:hypothetical protein